MTDEEFMQTAADVNDTLYSIIRQLEEEIAENHRTIQDLRNLLHDLIIG
jgi:hypothetical protein